MNALFPSLPSAALANLNLLPEALKRARPLNAAQRRSLPEDAAALSCLLTTERAELRRPYWAFPPFVSAYLYYFLPWNLVRLARLFSVLPLPEPDVGALLADIGSGPLSLPMALWLARPDMDSAPPQIFALDISPQPLELGRNLFAIWAELCGRRVWPVRIQRGAARGSARALSPLLSDRRTHLWLMSAANMLNEGGLGRAKGALARGESGGFRDGGSIRADLLRSFLALSRQGQSSLLTVEPGTRLGGKTVMALREQALEKGLAPRAPCTHSGQCPLQKGPRRAWCHFTFEADGAPEWLEQLSRQAGLSKTALSLSFLLLRPKDEERAAPETRPKFSPQDRGTPARILSEPFMVPNLAGKARYACCQRGLALLENAGDMPQGAELRIDVRPDTPRDAKSGALIARQGRTRPSALQKNLP
ncbi:MAG: hypothetical protein LBR31_01405 [Desulfovibrio sp.]|jgi:hypothetical protein|nr:hypothetical protein [Desulfovibrio sp.]